MSIDVCSVPAKGLWGEWVRGAVGRGSGEVDMFLLKSQIWELYIKECLP